jgi:hypothetical protein
MLHETQSQLELPSNLPQQIKAIIKYISLVKVLWQNCGTCVLELPPLLPQNNKALFTDVSPLYLP